MQSRADSNVIEILQVYFFPLRYICHPSADNSIFKSLNKYRQLIFLVNMHGYCLKGVLVSSFFFGCLLDFVSVTEVARSWQYMLLLGFA